MVQNEIATLEQRCIGLNVDSFIVMPNHVHAIVVINNDVGPVKSLSSVIRNIKTFTTRTYSSAVRTKNWPSFERRLWQRGYYESIIRDENGLNKIREYIVLNPSKWNNDTNNSDGLYL